MAASLAAVLIGADVTAMRVAIASKSGDGGKLFAASFNAQIASTTDMDLKAAAADRVTAETQPVMNGIAEKVNADGANDVAAALSALTTMGTAAQSALRSKADSDVAQSNTEALVATVVVKKTGAPPAAQSAGVELPRCPAQTFTESADVATLAGFDDPLKTPSTTDVTAPQEPALPVKAEQIAEVMPSPQKNLPQPVSQSETPAPVKAAADTPAQIDASQSGKNSAVAKVIVTKGPVEGAASVKKSAKRQEDAKDALQVKTADVTKSPAGMAVLNDVISASAPAQAVVVSASCAAVDPNVPDCKQQVVSQPAAKSISVHATAASKEGVQGTIVARDKGVVTQAAVAGKAATDGAASMASSGSDLSVAQRSSSAAVKDSASPTRAAGVLVAKPQSSDVATPSAHLMTGTANVMVSVIHSAAVASQKGATADASASVMVAHAGNGDPPSVLMQTVDGGHRTLLATPTVLEVGIPNGTQGWLKVRAELAGGGVNASVSAASSAGQEMLHRELPALTAYLQQEKVAVNSLVVHAPAGDAFRGLSSGLGSGSGGQMQGQAQGRSGRQPVSTASQMLFDGAHVPESDEVLTAMQSLRGGRWLSVRA